jgi:hypothetical protein
MRNNVVSKGDKALWLMYVGFWQVGFTGLARQGLTMCMYGV